MTVKVRLYKFPVTNKWEWQDDARGGVWHFVMLQFTEDYSLLQSVTMMGGGVRPDYFSGWIDVVNLAHIELGNGDVFNGETGVLTLAPGVPNYFPLPTIPERDPNMSASAAVIDQDGFTASLQREILLAGSDSNFSIATGKVADENGVVMSQVTLGVSATPEFQSLTVEQDATLNTVSATQLSATTSALGTATGSQIQVTGASQAGHFLANSYTPAQAAQAHSTGALPKHALFTLIAG